MELAFVHEGQQGVEDRGGGVEHLVQKHHLGALHLSDDVALQSRVFRVHQLGQIEIAEKLGRLGELRQQVFEIALVLPGGAGKGCRVLFARVVVQHADQAAECADQA